MWCHARPVAPIASRAPVSPHWPHAPRSRTDSRPPPLSARLQRRGGRGPITVPRWIRVIHVLSTVASLLPLFYYCPPYPRLCCLPAIGSLNVAYRHAHFMARVRLLVQPPANVGVVVPPCCSRPRLPRLLPILDLNGSASVWDGRSLTGM